MGGYRLEGDGRLLQWNLNHVRFGDSVMWSHTGSLVALRHYRLVNSVIVFGRLVAAMYSANHSMVALSSSSPMSVAALVDRSADTGKRHGLRSRYLFRHPGQCRFGELFVRRRVPYQQLECVAKELLPAMYQGKFCQGKVPAVMSRDCIGTLFRFHVLVVGW